MSSFEIIATGMKMAAVLGFVLTVVPIMVWLERRASAWMQGRVGPNRVGPFGLMQPLADVLKFLLKEDFIPSHVSKFYYTLGPAIALVAPLTAFAVIPFGSFLVINGEKIPLQIADLNMGFLFILAFAGLEVYPIMIAGWASNNKYAVLGALRGSSQIVSYEIAMGLSLISMLMIYSSVNLHDIVAFQHESLWAWLPRWGVFLNPIAALIFLVSIFAETNRLPFDLPEGEAEIVAGYHVEYASIKFGLFFMAEYIAMTMASGMLVTLFFGGYGLLPGMTGLIEHATNLLGARVSMSAEDLAQNLRAIGEVITFTVKIGIVMFFYVWVRWTFPRFRFDQLMDLGWKILFPLAMANLTAVTIILYLMKG
jgi:NADH-quinone oxidoreductase subunit H